MIEDAANVAWWRRPATILGALGVLAVGAGVVWAQSSKPAAPVEAEAPDSGAATSAGNRIWLWSGDALCQSRRASSTALISIDDQGPQSLQVPLLTVNALAAADEQHVIAVGRDRDCARAAVASADGGRTWVPYEATGGISVDAASNGTVWAVGVDPEPSVTRLVPAGKLHHLAEATCRPPTSPSLISVANAREAWLLCQDDLGLQRTLLHTDDGGESWDVPANELSGSGLDGVGIVRALDMHLRTVGWLLKPARRCPEGELRTTRDGGSHWSLLPCPQESIPVSNVLTVRFVDPTHGFLIGVRGSSAVLATTDDGGSSWTMSGPQTGADGGQ